MNPIERALAYREGGHTIRCHTLQYLGHYNVAMHSYNMMSLLLLLYPNTPSLNLIKAIQWHDIPERWTGDVPTPAKMASSLLRSELYQLEQKVLEKLGIGELFLCLSEQEKQWLAAIDLLELFMWGREQYELGNTSVSSMNEQILKIFYNNWDTIPPEVQSFIENFIWNRTVECHTLIQGESHG